MALDTQEDYLTGETPDDVANVYDHHHSLGKACAVCAKDTCGECNETECKNCLEPVCSEKCGDKLVAGFCPACGALGDE